MSALRRALPKFNSDNCMDLAAGLTYHAVLSLFPTLIVLVSLLGVVGRGEETLNAVMELLNDMAPQTTVDFLQGPINQLVKTDAAGFALIAGLAGALWTASGYVGAFGRALNRIYGVTEGRAIWWRRPALLVVTAVMVVLLACAGVILTLTGGLAERIFRFVGLGDLALTVWSWSKWPALVAIIVLVVAILYQATSNIRPERFRFISPGSIVALVGSAVGIWGFSFYASHFGNYNATYGSLAGAIIFMFLVWIANNALLLGAEIDSELTRAALLLEGVAAEEDLPLPLRSVTGIVKTHDKLDRAVSRSADLRLRADAEQAFRQDDDS